MPTIIICRDFFGQVPQIVMVSDSTYTPSDQVDLLAGVGEAATFEVSATNDGNVDLDNTVVSNDLFENGAGGCLQLQSSYACMPDVQSCMYARYRKLKCLQRRG